MATPPHAFTSLAITAALAYVPHAVRAALVHAKLGEMKRAGAKVPGGYDVRNPRASTALASDSTPEGRFIARANACHVNALENYPLFAAAVLAAVQAGVAPADVNSAAAAYVGLRVLYTVLFLTGTSMPVAFTRSLTWGASIAVVCSLFLDAARRHTL